MNINDFDLTIVGGGSAAFAAAIKAEELGLTTLIVNGGLPIGGTCVNVGCLPSKFLIRAGESIHRASHSPFCGIKPCKPDWNYTTIIRQKKELIAEMQQKKYLDVVKGFKNLTIIEGKAKFVDEKTISVNGSDEYTAKNFLIATGSATQVPHIEGLDTVPYFTNDTLFDLEELPESLLVIGGGYIGLEIAQAYRRFGSKVRIVEYFDRILNTQTPDITDELASHLMNEGIEIETGIKVEKVGKTGESILLMGKKGNEAVMFESSHLLIATGRKPNTNNVGLEKLGIAMQKSGHIIVNKYMQTSVQHIYAAGDCNQNPPFVYTAAYEGNLAVQKIIACCEEEFKAADFTGMPWVIFTDPQVAGVGIDEAEAEAKHIPFEVSVVPLSEVPRNIAALDTRGFIKLIRNPENDKLLGARIVAPEGGDLTMELSLAIKYGITVNELVNAFHPYLTLSEGIKLAAIGFRKDIHALSCCAV